MKSSKVFKKGLAMVCAATTIATLTPSVGLLTSTVSTFAATKVKVVPKSTSVKVGDTNTITIKNVTKKQYIKVKVMGSAKKSVTVKKGSKTIKASTKIKGTGKKIALKATSASEGKYRLVVKVYKKNGKKVGKGKTAPITVSAASTAFRAALSEIAQRGVLPQLLAAGGEQDIALGPV